MGRKRVIGTKRETYPLVFIAKTPVGSPLILDYWTTSGRAKVALECGHTLMVPWPVEGMNRRRRCQKCGEGVQAVAVQGGKDES